jgi:hypothetical protein
MTVLLNDQPLSLAHLSPEATVVEVINEAKARLEGTGTVIVALRHNNEVVPAEHVERMLAEPISGFEHLELITGRPREVVLEALEQVREGFRDTFAVVKEAAEALAAGKLSDAMTQLSACLGLWGRAHESLIQGGSLLGLSFDDLEIGGRPITAWLNELAGKLRELKEAIESRDNVLLGDILRYELDETLQQWERMLDGIITHVEQLEDPASAGGQ